MDLTSSRALMSYCLLTLSLASYFFPASSVSVPFSIATGWIGFVTLVNHAAKFMPKVAKGKIHWAHALTFEILALLAVFFLRPLSAFKRYLKPEGKKGGRPILLVHGYLNYASVWHFHRKRLKDAGLGPIYMLNLRRPFHSIRDHAEKVGQMVETIVQETGTNEVVLIGHSMGGMVSVYYTTKLAPPGRVSDCITIASPLAGTHMAQIAIGKNGNEMKRGSLLVQELQEELCRATETRFYQVATKTDPLVIPYESCLVPGNSLDRQYVIEDLGHATLLFSRRVVKKVVEWIR